LLALVVVEIKPKVDHCCILQALESKHTRTVDNTARKHAPRGNETVETLLIRKHHDDDDDDVVVFVIAVLNVVVVVVVVADG
jgi:hypothetical protein